MGTTKLIIVQRAKVATFGYLRDKFADDPNVRVVLDRRVEQEPTAVLARDRRRLYKSSERDYVVVHSPGEGYEFQNGLRGDESVQDRRTAVMYEQSESWWGKAEFN